jgi:hypothetical protein
MLSTSVRQTRTGGEALSVTMHPTLIRSAVDLVAGAASVRRRSNEVGSQVRPEVLIRVRLGRAATQEAGRREPGQKNQHGQTTEGRRFRHRELGHAAPAFGKAAIERGDAHSDGGISMDATRSDGATPNFTAQKLVEALLRPSGHPPSVNRT